MGDTPSPKRSRVPVNRQGVLVRSGDVSLRRVTGGVGKTLLALGVLVGLFAGHQLWGTGFAERRGQRALAAQFAQRQAAASPVTVPGATAPELPPVALGDAVGLIEIPAIDLEKLVGQGVAPEHLESGPGHYPGTPMPGQRGNAAIAGHRTTYGAPFYDLDALRPGDAIFVTTDAGRFQYDVMESHIVDPVGGVWVLDPTADDRLTLTTCNPKFSAAQRLIVTARLVSTPSDTVTPTADAPPSIVAGLDVGPNLTGGRAGVERAVLWAAVAAVVWITAWQVARAWRRWPAYALGVIPFLAALFMFYESLARLLPADV